MLVHVKSIYFPICKYLLFRDTHSFAHNSVILCNNAVNVSCYEYCVPNRYELLAWRWLFLGQWWETLTYKLYSVIVKWSVNTSVLQLYPDRFSKLPTSNKFSLIDYHNMLLRLSRLQSDWTTWWMTTVRFPMGAGIFHPIGLSYCLWGPSSLHVASFNFEEVLELSMHFTLALFAIMRTLLAYMLIYWR